MERFCFGEDQAMGVSIHYRGRLDDIHLASLLCDEVGDIARSMGWPSTTLDDDWSIPPDARLIGGGRIGGHLGLKGIQITPHPESEPLALFFDREGHLRSPMTMLMILDGTMTSETAWISMKTQFAGADTHVWVVGLLKYLKKRYIANLEVSDESEYWGTGDRQKLEKDMDFINSKLQWMSSEISAGRLGDLTGLSADEIGLRIENLFRQDQ
jgi:hypothetical protein